MTNLSAVSTQDGPNIIFKLALSDLNALQLESLLCVFPHNCFISIRSGGISDTSGNSLVGTGLSTELFAQSVNRDTTPPRVVSYSLDMNVGRLSLTFDETVAVSTLRPQYISLQATATGGDSVPLTFTGESIVTTTDGLIMDLAISTDDLNAIKLRGFCTDKGNTYLSLKRETIKDMATNSVVEISATNALPLNDGSYTPDATQPRISGFTFDANSGELVLTFNEPVNTSNVNISAIVVQSYQNSTEANLRQN
jgi:hypothetical protein